MFHTEKKFILASQSPRRRMFLEALGIRFSVTAASIDEIIENQESPQTFVERMAFEKAMDVSRQHQSAWVLSADTIVYIEDKVFGKPGSEEEAVEMLMILSGREHNVMTGYCLACAELNINIIERVCTSVRFAGFKEDIAHAYVQTGEPLDKAGSYGIQGKGGALVEAISGSYSNVVGLPLVETLALLQRFKVISVV